MLTPPEPDRQCAAGRWRSIRMPARRDRILGVLPLFHVFANTCVLNRTVLNGGVHRDAAALRRGPGAGRAQPHQGDRAARRADDVPGAARSSGIGRDRFLSRCASASRAARRCPPNSRRSSRRRPARAVVEGYGLSESSGVVSTNPYERRRQARHDRPADPRARACGWSTRKIPTQPRAATANRASSSSRARRSCRAIGTAPTPTPKCSSATTACAGCAPAMSATIDADGFIRIVDRLKDMIAVGGFKVFPSQIEAVLLPSSGGEGGAGDRPARRLSRRTCRAPMSRSTTRSRRRRQELRDWLNPQLGKHERVDRGRRPPDDAQDDDRQIEPQGSGGGSDGGAGGIGRLRPIIDRPWPELPAQPI